MNTMDCKDIKALLSAIIDDELDAEHRHEAERHLADCSDCRAIVNEAEGLNDMIAMDAQAGVDGMSLPPDFEQRVLQRTIYAGDGRSRRHAWGMWSGWLAAAASLALAAFLWIGGQQQSSTPGDSLAISGQAEAIGGAPSQPSSHRQNQPVVRPAAYTTGVDLRSQTFDGGLPAEAFRVQRASLTDVTMPYDPVFVWSDGVQRDDVSASPQAQARSPLSRDDADTLFSASVLIDRFIGADLNSFADVEHIRQVIELDDLLPRLSAAREQVSHADRPIVFAAESVLLRIAHGPLDRDDAIVLQETVERMNLAVEIEAMTER